MDTRAALSRMETMGTKPDLSWLVACPGMERAEARHCADLTDEDRAGIDEDVRFERTHDAAN